MATSWEEGKLWIQASCRSRERWSQQGNSYPKYAAWVAPTQTNQVMRPVSERYGFKYSNLVSIICTQLYGFK